MMISAMISENDLKVKTNILFKKKKCFYNLLSKTKLDYELIEKIKKKIL